jgi:hypothetical protein
MAEETFLGMIYGSPRSLEEGERLGSKQGRPMNRERCEHTTYPVEVLHVDGGKKKIACCLGCGRTGPVCERSMEAVIALREIPHMAFRQGRRRRSLR